MQKFAELEYKRIDLDSFKQSFDKLMEQFKNAQDALEQEAAIYEANRLKEEFNTALHISSIRNSIDTSNSFYEQEKSFFNVAEAEVFDADMQFYKLLTQSRFRDILEARLGKEFFRQAEILARTSSPAIIADLQEENELVTQYYKLTAGAQIEFRGATYNHTGLRTFEQDADRDTRREAAKANSDWWEANNARLDEIFDALVKIRVRIAQKLGYKSFVDLAYNLMGRTDYNAADVAGFRQQIRDEVVPVCNSLRERQRVRLGLDKLKFYDAPLNFLSGNATPKGEPAWIIENGRKMYAGLSPETKEFFDFMLEFNLMDLENRKNKRGGGYCSTLPAYKAPFIFSNFNGTEHDIRVLTHEAGHAFQYYQARHNGLLEHVRSTADVAEIHSMSMELFTWPWMELFFKEDTMKFKFSHLSMAISFLPFGAAVDEFQQAIYEHPEMTAAERDETWKQIEREYRPYLDFDGFEFLERGTSWKRILHIYGMPFYFIDYCLAQICAFQFWRRSLNNDPDAWKDYLALCKAGGTQSFLELLELAHLSNPFKPSTIQPIVADVRAWLEGVDDGAL